MLRAPGSISLLSISLLPGLAALPWLAVFALALGAETATAQTIACPTPSDPASSLGCVFYAFDADNALDANQFSIVVANLAGNGQAAVEVQTRVAGVWQPTLTANVAAGSHHQFDLSDRHIEGTGFHSAGAYRVVSDRPVAAYQYQPSVPSATSDASLLLPANALDRSYQILGGIGDNDGAQLVVVASEDDTALTITPSVSTVGGGFIPGLTADVPYTVPLPLDAGDYVQIESSLGLGLSGSTVEADRPVAVFSTHPCANVPPGVLICEHLEEQLMGLQSWGETLVASRMPVRSVGAVETTHWQIGASEDDTQLTFVASPDVTGLPVSPQTLNAGEFLSLEVGGTTTHPGDFVVQSSAPVLLMEFLSGSGNVVGVGGDQTGDPAMTQVAPVAQFQTDYVIFVGQVWNNDLLVLTRTIGTTISVDGVPVSAASFTAIDDGVATPEWEVARVFVSDGRHDLSGSAPFGVTVVSFDSFESNAYPGGMGQLLINPPAGPAVPILSPPLLGVLVLVLATSAVFMLRRLKTRPEVRPAR